MQHQPSQALTTAESNQILAQVAKPRYILEEIVWHKQQEVAQMREQLPPTDLKNQVNATPSTRNFLLALRQNSAQLSLIAEVKKASPAGAHAVFAKCAKY